MEAPLINAPKQLNYNKMSKTKEVVKTVGSFLNECMARIQGDDAKAKSLKIQRRAIASLRAQTAIKEASTITLEDNVEEKQESLSEARVNNGKLITDNKSYLKGLADAKNRLEAAEQELTDHNAEVSFLQEQMKAVKA